MDEHRRETHGLEACHDPLVRVFAASPLAQPTPDAAAARALPGMLAPELLQLLRRVAWSGDRSRGVAYLEIGAGELAGATLTIESHSGQVSLALELPPGASSRDWEQRLSSRLERCGLNVASVVVS